MPDVPPLKTYQLFNGNQAVDCFKRRLDELKMKVKIVESAEEL